MSPVRRDVVGGNEHTIRVIRRWKSPPAEVLLVGSRAEAIREDLCAEGYRIASDDTFESSDGIDVALIERAPEEGGTAVANTLRRLHEILEPEGLLVVKGTLSWGSEHPPGSWPATELVASLYESAFVVLAREILEDRHQQGEAPPIHREGPIREEIVAARREEYRVRSYAPGDEHPILELFHQAFPHDRRDLEHWRWKHLRNPCGGPFLSLAVDAEDRIGAHYAGYPVRFRDATGGRPRTFQAFHIGDTMTARWAQGIGGRRTALLVRATQHFFHRHCAYRVGFNYGFNTGKIHRFYLRIVPGSEYLEPAPYRVLDRQRLAPAGRSFLERNGDRLAVDTVGVVDGAWDELFERAATSYGLLAERRAEYLTWRYLDRPDRRYQLLAVRRSGRLVGWGVFRREGDALVWGDALFEPGRENLAGLLLERALAEPENDDVEKIEAWFPRRPAFWNLALERLGFERQEEPEELALIYMAFEERDLARRFREDLYYSLGDSDLF